MEDSVFNKIDTVSEFRKLKNEIEKNFLSVHAVCKEAKVSPSTVSNWNNGSREPRPHVLNKMKAAFDRLIEKRDAEGR